MATTSRKPSKAPPKTESKSSLVTQGGRREKQARGASILLKHISDPTRLEVILILAKGEQNVGTLCVRLSQSQPAISHHLALLRHGRIIAPRREGAKNSYGLTDTGFVLAKVVQTLLEKHTGERPTVRPRPTRTNSPPTESPQPAREKSSTLPGVPDLGSDVQVGADEDSWNCMNRRRAELIFKKNRGNLKDAERSELERLQTLSRSRMQSEFPSPTLIDDKLKQIEERLRRERVENS